MIAHCGCCSRLVSICSRFSCVNYFDFALSCVIKTHSELVKLGVEADLHVWEGLGHAFLYDGELPEAREAFDVMINFFDRRLGLSCSE